VMGKGGKWEMGNGRVGRADGNETDGMCSPVNWNG